MQLFLKYLFMSRLGWFGVNSFHIPECYECESLCVKIPTCKKFGKSVLFSAAGLKLRKDFFVASCRNENV